jgi:regulator of RNase E activity RraA
MMTTRTLSAETLHALSTFDTPTISNALERFHVRSRIDGVADTSIRQIIPYGKTFIGYACTASISARQPAQSDNRSVARRYFEQFNKISGPSIAVIQDLDADPIGSFWGEVNATVHKALGCIATITNGGVRDVREVATLGFGFFAKCTLVTHGYVHFEECAQPVVVGNLTVKPNDLIAADEHGVLLIPAETADSLLDACRKAAQAEFPILEGARRAIALGRRLTVDEIMDLRESMYKLRQSL